MSITPAVASVWPLRQPVYEGLIAGTFAPYVTVGLEAVTVMVFLRIVTAPFE